jgi:CHAT domain/Translocon-associated protein beta (TRAPB)
MIEVSVEPTRLVVGRRTQLAIRFTNHGQRACSDIVFKLALPSAFMITSGTTRAETALIQPGRVHIHTITVEPRKLGEYQLTSTNFSYRDEFDMPIRVTDFRARLSIEAPIPVPPAPVPRQPVGRLNVEHADGELALGEWNILRIFVRNDTGIPLSDVTMAVSGPFRTDGKQARIAVLGDGAAAKFPFHVIADEGGRHVPISVRTTYSYADGLGSVRSQEQEDNLSVLVAKPGTPDSLQPVSPPGGVGEQTILYLAASPRDMEPLRSDLEMRKVKERLQLSKHRDRYRIELCPAAQFDDISQALMDHKPQVVHFSGHGDKDGNLCLEDPMGNRELVTPEGLADRFGLCKGTIKCVIVNACYSMRLANAMARHINYVVGMRRQIGDEAAIQFSVGFYLGLFAGQPVPDAFNLGCAHIHARLATELEHVTPVLLEGPGSGSRTSPGQQAAG